MVNDLYKFDKTKANHQYNMNNIRTTQSTSEGLVKAFKRKEAEEFLRAPKVAKLEDTNETISTADKFLFSLDDTNGDISLEDIEFSDSESDDREEKDRYDDVAEIQAKLLAGCDLSDDDDD